MAKTTVPRSAFVEGGLKLFKKHVCSQVSIPMVLHVVRNRRIVLPLLAGNLPCLELCLCKAVDLLASSWPQYSTHIYLFRRNN